MSKISERQLRRVLTAFEAAGHSKERNNKEPHSLNQMQVARLCASHGLAVVPSHGLKKKDRQCTCGDQKCNRPGRHPRTTQGLQDATGNEALIRQFWTKWPVARIIIATGTEGIIAVTATGREGQRALKALVANSEETLAFRGRRSLTYLLRAPEDAIPNGEAEIANGVVVRGRGGFVLVPRKMTSPRRSKPLYGTEIAPAPDWLLKLIGSPAHSARSDPEKAAPNAPSKNDEDAGSPDRLTASEREDTKPHERSGISKRTFAKTLEFDLCRLALDWIIVPDGSPTCDAKKVQVLADSYRMTGVRGPLVVRKVDGGTRDADPIFCLLSDPHRLEALKRLGVTAADCVVVEGNAADQRLWEIADLLHQPELKVLDWALLVIEWVKLLQKGGQLAHPRGGKQPHNKGLTAAEKVLGVSRRDLGRAEKIASICSEAQEEARGAKLDNIQQGLLEIAAEPPEKQVEKVCELKDRYSKPRGKRKPIDGGNVDARGAERSTSDRDVASLEDAEKEPDHLNDSPDTAPSDLPEGVGAVTVRGRTTDERKFEELRSRWETYLADAWENAPAAVRRRFITDVLGCKEDSSQPGDHKSLKLRFCE
jgi:hypothetical protein